MKVTVKNVFLNVRVGKPSVNAPCYQYLAPGSELEVDGQLYKGDAFEGSDLWYRDKAGNYYWAGGVQGTDTPSPRVTDDQSAAYAYWHLQRHGIRSLHAGGRTGEGVSICMIDSGVVRMHPDLADADMQQAAFNPANAVEDRLGHGTSCMGILAAQGKKLMGIAPRAKLYAYHAFDGRVTRYADFRNAIRAAAKIDGIRVISISIDFPFIDPMLQGEIADMVKNGICIVVGHGNADMEYNRLGDIPGVISVGALDADNNLYQNTCRDGSFTLAAPGGNVYSTTLTDYNYVSGTSFATPFVAGICALLLQKENLDPTQVRTRLVEAADKLIIEGKTILSINPKRTLKL